MNGITIIPHKLQNDLRTCRIYIGEGPARVIREREHHELDTYRELQKY